MVRDVRYITLTSSYRELQEMLLTGQLKTLALVESRGEKNPYIFINVRIPRVIHSLILRLLHLSVVLQTP